MDFDYGTGVENVEEVQGGNGRVKNEKLPEAGDHAFRVRSIVHLGVSESFNYTTKESAGFHPKCVLVMELMEDDDFETDGETRMTITKDIEIKKGDKANLSLFCAAIRNPALVGREGKPDFICTNFEEMIGAIGTVTIDESKCGKYRNVRAFNKGGVSTLHQKLWKMIDECQGGVGNVKFTDMTVEALEEIHAWNHVADILMQGRDYEGSKAQECVEAIRAMEGRQDFAKKDVKKKTEAPNPSVDMDEDEEY